MKQITQNYKTGSISLADVEWPALKSGGVLIRSRYSVVSTGTEGMKVREGKLSYLGKARARPDQLKKVLDTVRQQGVVAAYNKVMNKLDQLTSLGYSLAGEVIAVGQGAEEFQIGQRVACAGAGYANHAEINFVPRNLVVPVPEKVSMQHAAFATVGSIALQGYRQAQMQLGETACVIGLGLLGQLLVQILRAGGMRVVGIDLVAARCRLAEKLGAQAASTPDDPALEGLITRFTDGVGVDCVFITAGGASNAATELAVHIARDRARIVDVGKTKLDLPWNDCYLKELDVRFSRSYGPGRYDPDYEERGIDYPIGYVRWTERRNLASFLDLVADGKVLIDPIVSAVRPFQDAEAVYQELAQPGCEALGIVLDYGETDDAHPEASALPQRVARTPKPRAAAGKLRLGVIGAGNYASSMLLPHLKANRYVELDTVATATSLSGENARRKFGFASATTSYRELLERPDIDAVLIATRHAAHARMAAEALRAGKAVYVEKPLAITLDELDLVRRAVLETGNDRLMVGFNRRFSPMALTLAQRLGDRAFPLMAHYRVQAGRMESNSWYLDPSEGSRFTGEAGHFFDLLGFLIGGRPIAVSATTLRPPRMTADDVENVAAVVRYDNGSVGNLIYLTQGGAKLPKEYLELHGGAMTWQLNNFESLRLFDQQRDQRVQSGRIDKGQQAELEAFVEAVRSDKPMPISLESLFETTLTTLGAMESIRTGREVVLTGYLTEKTTTASE